VTKRSTGSAATRLWLITRGAQRAQGSSVDPVQAAVWGLGRVMRAEHPECHGGLIDLDPGISAGDGEQARRVVCELLAADAAGRDDQIAFRGDGRLVPRITACEVESRATPRAAVQPGAGYLVTGGLGALGLAVTEWLVASGAGHVTLAARRAPTEAAQSVLERLRGRGASISVVPADVAADADVNALLTHCDRADAPLRGVVHAAGVLDDGLLAQLTPERVRAVLAPKVAGAWNLHCHPSSRSLDFFVLFSSVAGVLGFHGQGSYAAGNAFLDALSQARRAAGLPAVSIAWGPWAEAGMAARAARQRAGRWRGFHPISPAQGVAWLERALTCTDGHVIIAAVDAKTLLRGRGGGVPAVLSDAIDPRLLSELSTAPSDMAARLTAAPAGDRLVMLEDHLRGELARVLQIEDANSIDRHAGFFEMGMDSMMATELREQLQTSLGCPLPATLVFELPTISALAHHLLAHVFHLSTAPPAIQEATPALTKLRQQFDGLPDAEIAALLADELVALQQRRSP
jgi:NAD(P)-dependent dehydrogenase (short-subunit alcohol dehydrogenase family)/acyl carrier protein